MGANLSRLVACAPGETGILVQDSRDLGGKIFPRGFLGNLYYGRTPLDGDPQQPVTQLTFVAEAVIISI